VLTGLIWDDQGNRMTPSYSRKADDGPRYAYYVSQARLRGREADAASAPRIQADAIEDLVLDRVQRLVGGAGTDIAVALLHRLVTRVEIAAESITIRLNREQLIEALQDCDASAQGRLETRSLSDLGERLDSDGYLHDGGEHVDLILAVRLVRRGHVTAIERPNGEPVLGKAQHDGALLKAIARAHGWLDQLICGEADTLRAVATREGVEERYIRRMLPLAFLAPSDLARALDGRQPAGLTVDRIAKHGLPLGWPADDRR
jgi:hypothetical protein